jgi:TonB family protein
MEYPRGARPAKGTVVVRALVDSKGRVGGTEIVSSPDKRLSSAAVATLKKWRYTPATRNGLPIDVWWTETFQFMPPEEEIAAILGCDPTKVDAGTVTDLRNVVLPKILRSAEPVWSGAMTARGRPGHVKLQCVVDLCGRVGQCEALETSGPEYTDAAIAAVQKRLYRPATAGGKPVAIYFTIEVNFRM